MSTDWMSWLPTGKPVSLASSQRMAVLNKILCARLQGHGVCMCRACNSLVFKVENKMSFLQLAYTSAFWEKSCLCSCHPWQSGSLLRMAVLDKILCVPVWKVQKFLTRSWVCKKQLQSVQWATLSKCALQVCTSWKLSNEKCSKVF